MTGFDLVVLLIVGLGAITGFMRGFVEEVLALFAWVFAIFAVRYLHTPLNEALAPMLDYSNATPILAFAILLLIPYAVVKTIGAQFGKAARNSPLGPIDRVLGFGFGAVKGVIICVFAFSVLVLGYDQTWGVSGRPAWIKDARSYTFINSASQSLVELIAQRRAAVEQAQREREEGSETAE